MNLSLTLKRDIHPLIALLGLYSCGCLFGCLLLGGEPISHWWTVDIGTIVILEGDDKINILLAFLSRDKTAQPTMINDQTFLLTNPSSSLAYFLGSLELWPGIKGT